MAREEALSSTTPPLTVLNVFIETRRRIGLDKVKVVVDCQAK